MKLKFNFSKQKDQRLSNVFVLVNRECFRRKKKAEAGFAKNFSWRGGEPKLKGKSKGRGKKHQGINIIFMWKHHSEENRKLDRGIWSVWKGLMHKLWRIYRVKLPEECLLIIIGLCGCLKIRLFSWERTSYGTNILASFLKSKSKNSGIPLMCQKRD